MEAAFHRILWVEVSVTSAVRKFTSMLSKCILTHKDERMIRCALFIVPGKSIKTGRLFKTQ